MMMGRGDLGHMEWYGEGWWKNTQSLASAVGNVLTILKKQIFTGKGLNLIQPPQSWAIYSKALDLPVNWDLIIFLYMSLFRNSNLSSRVFMHQFLLLIISLRGDSTFALVTQVPSQETCCLLAFPICTQFPKVWDTSDLRITFKFPAWNPWP